MNLNQALESVARNASDSIALQHNNRELSYRELFHRIELFASALSSKNIHKGDRVALYLNNSIEFVISYLGTLKLGAIAVLLDPKYKEIELASLISDCQPRVIVADTANVGVSHLPRFESIEVYISVGEARTGSIWFEDFLVLGSTQTAFSDVRVSDIAHIAYTSGPSLDPRGVVVIHGNLVKEIELSSAGFKQSSKDVVIQFALPMHHVIGLVVVLLASLYCGCKLVVLDGVSIESLLVTIEKQHISMFMGVPFIHAMVLRKVKEEGIRHDLSSLRLSASAGDLLPFRMVEGYRNLLGRKLVNFYGLTETLGHVTCELLDSPDTPGSAGPPLPGWQVRIVDSDGVDVPRGATGEIIISGPMMEGYYRKPAVNREAIRDGWLHTGDNGMFDELGNLHPLGLQKDMLICKGQNIFPSDIETILRRHHAVHDAAVVGVPDEMRGEVIGAAIVLKPGEPTTEAALTKYCLDHLANYKTPKYYLFLEKLPLDVCKKTDKQIIRDKFVTVNSVKKQPE
jgi:long-chain acyl-CoA synthetase